VFLGDYDSNMMLLLNILLMHVVMLNDVSLSCIILTLTVAFQKILVIFANISILFCRSTTATRLPVNFVCSLMLL